MHNQRHAHVPRLNQHEAFLSSFPSYAAPLPPFDESTLNGPSQKRCGDGERKGRSERERAMAILKALSIMGGMTGKPSPPPLPPLCVSHSTPGPLTQGPPSQQRAPRPIQARRRVPTWWLGEIEQRSLAREHKALPPTTSPNPVPSTLCPRPDPTTPRASSPARIMVLLSPEPEPQPDPQSQSKSQSQPEPEPEPEPEPDSESKPKIPLIVTQVVEYFQHALSLQCENVEQAKEAFSSVLQMDNDFDKADEIFFRLGIIYKQQQKYKEALKLATVLVRLLEGSSPSAYSATDVKNSINTYPCV
ncbi:unnamed protein product, partial [Rhizoctonia solani]